MTYNSSRRADLVAVAFAVAAVTAACGSDAGGPTSAVAPSTIASSGTAAPSTPGTGVATIANVVDVPVTIDVNAGQVGTWNYAGESVTTPAGGPYNNLSFNWYDYATRAGQPTAFGRLYVLTQEFTGLPGGLGVTTPGYLARSDAAPVGSGLGSQGQGTAYTFPPDVTLEGGRMYWFYTDAKGAFAYTFDQDVYPGGELYLTGAASYPFHVAMASGRETASGFVPAPPGLTVDGNFRLLGATK